MTTSIYVAIQNEAGPKFFWSGVNSLKNQPTIAIIGASQDRRKFGNKAVRAYLKRGYCVFPIHPTEREIEGHPAFRHLAEIPVRPVDRVSLYVPPGVGEKLLDEIAVVGCRELWVNPGAESESLTLRAEKLGLNVIQACSIVDIGETPHDFMEG